MILQTQSYLVHFYEDFHKLLSELKHFENYVILFDRNFFEIWKERLEPLLVLPFYVIPSGEENKNLKTLEAIWQFFFENKVERTTTVIAWGGGVVGDIGGFAAATYLRGIPYIQIPTTLLAMVDSSIGSKTAIDFMNTKNLIGAFYSPQKVLICYEFLSSLEKRHWVAGQAEMFKHAMIYDKNHFQDVQNVTLGGIFRSIEIKKYFVEKDPYEKNIRKALNLGHTIGHALESYALTRGISLLHGEAVFWGMYMEMLAFRNLGLCSEELFDEFQNWIDEYLDGISFNPFALELEEWFSFVHWDKKKEDKSITMALIKELGGFELRKVMVEELREGIKRGQGKV